MFVSAIKEICKTVKKQILKNIVLHWTLPSDNHSAFPAMF
jgi:hypothetical protein